MECIDVQVDDIVPNSKEPKEKIDRGYDFIEFEEQEVSEEEKEEEYQNTP